MPRSERNAAEKRFTRRCRRDGYAPPRLAEAEISACTLTGLMSGFRGNLADGDFRTMSPKSIPSGPSARYLVNSSHLNCRLGARFVQSEGSTQEGRESRKLPPP